MTASLVGHDQTRQLTILQAGALQLLVPLLDREAGSQVRVRVPAREVILAATAPGPTSVHNVIIGSVRAIAKDESKHTAIVEVAIDGNASLLARVTPDAIGRLNLIVGREVAALVKSMSLEVLPG